MNRGTFPGELPSRLTPSSQAITFFAGAARETLGFGLEGKSGMLDDIDLLGHAPAQGSLFGSGEDRLQAPVQRFVPDPETVRRRLNLLLDKARSAKQMPWSERDARMWQIVFPNMANWLPEDEAEQLRFEFAREMERLRQAA